MQISDSELLQLAVRLGRRLAKRSQVVTTAESCTGGWIAKTLTDVPGSSAWFEEGFVTYSNEAKARRLGVPRSVLEREGAVSEATARAMAQGALERTGASLAVAVTGIAGPGGGVPGKPVGTVWFCWVEARRGRLHTQVERKHFRGDREAVRRKTVRWALARLLRFGSGGM
jgi:nicotinamide-nucleotide amidase